MKKLIISMFMVVGLALSFGVVSPEAANAQGAPSPVAVDAAAEENNACSDSVLLGLPNWYKYLETEPTTDALTGRPTCNVKMDGLQDVWLIVAAVVDLLLRLSAIVSIGVIIYAGFTYMLSQAQPDKTSQAMKTVIGAFIGLTISIGAAAIVSFVAGRF